MVHFQYLSRFANDIVLLLDDAGRIVECNDRAVAAYGYPAPELVGKSLHDLRADGAVPRFKGAHGTNDGLLYEIAHRRRDGSQFPVEVSLRLNESRGRPMSQAIIRDVSERKREEARLRLDALAFEHARDAMLIADAQGLIVAVNRAFTAITGYEPDEVVGRNPRFLASGRHDAAFYAALWRSVETSGYWQGEIWNRRKNGQLFVERQTITAVHDAAGVLTHYLSVFSDVTERREVEDQLRFQAHVLDCVGEAIVATDGEERITYWNHGAEELLGWTEAQMLGRELEAVMAPPESGVERVSVRSLAVTDATWSGELALARRDGVRFMAQVTLSAMFTDGARFGGYILVARDVTERKRFETQLAFLAQYDALTELPNRNLFRERLARAVLRAARHRRRVGLMFFDLDRFKKVNDNYGHAAGDALLQQIARRLRGGLRSVDTLCRLGGDEFTVIVEDVRERADLECVADKILALTAAPVVLDAGEAHVTASIGIAVYPDDADDLEGLLKAGDLAMYQAKHAGRNGYQFYASQRTVPGPLAATRERELRRALERDEFSIVFQPRVAAGSRHVVAIEALLRWENAQLGAVSPQDFIPLAEETGLIVPIGDWALREACRQWRQWRLRSPVVLSVNLSTLQFQQPGAIQRLLGIVAECGMDPRYLEFEITESSVVRDAAAGAQRLTLLRDAGVSLSIDDFGTGFSSLAYLRQLPVNALKIDKSFIGDVPHDADSGAIVKAIVAMAHHLKLRVVAEGVENQAQLDFLTDLGCDEYQGYYFSPPVAGEAAGDYARAAGQAAMGRVYALPVRRS